MFKLVSPPPIALAYLIATNPTLDTATATRTALVTDVLPVMQGSRNAAVKQNLERCRI